MEGKFKGDNFHFQSANLMKVIPFSSLEERLYAQQDANLDVTSLVTPAQVVAQRIVYDPYGTPTLLTSAWATTTDTYYMHVLFQGAQWLGVANVYQMGARNFDYTMGTWDQQDPAGYIDGSSLYQGFDSNPVALSDPFGQNPSNYGADTPNPRPTEDQISARVRDLLGQAKDAAERGDTEMEDRLNNEIERIQQWRHGNRNAPPPSLNISVCPAVKTALPPPGPPPAIKVATPPPGPLAVVVAIPIALTVTELAAIAAARKAAALVEVGAKATAAETALLAHTAAQMAEDALNAAERAMPNINNANPSMPFPGIPSPARHR